MFIRMGLRQLEQRRWVTTGNKPSLPTGNASSLRGWDMAILVQFTVQVIYQLLRGNYVPWDMEHTAVRRVFCGHAIGDYHGSRITPVADRHPNSNYLVDLALRRVARISAR
jgi:hypothetical protein